MQDFTTTKLLVVDLGASMHISEHIYVLISVKQT